MVVERRRPAPDTSLGYLWQLPAMILLDRLPSPMVAVHVDGTLVYANPAFEQLVGWDRSELDAETFEKLPALATTESADRSPLYTALRESAGHLVDLVHSDGSLVRTIVSTSVLLRQDDPLALVTFYDLTDQLWANGPDAAIPPAFLEPK
ncbi:PAS domain-containing protein [Antrihabitans sp. YC3-6]|uniref:PAS domain-containing protein n=1 Tax=Antrihabitans stalagmiti TaxID=2799499 RepID=A0A934NQS0_9NOCA|nr:PAS domain S-box protein [Antrihabitans stalagmiti]MBJ8339696.1 PAS domain-containing protein [Antrihabitans stalagmiti]